MAATRITTQDIKDATITDTDVAAANKDGSAGTASMRTLGTGASQAAAGNHTHASAFTLVENEVPAGTVNGVNAAFTLANTPLAGSQAIYKNGIRQTPGASNDYTISTNTITFLAGNIPQTGDNLLADYRF